MSRHKAKRKPKHKTSKPHATNLPGGSYHFTGPVLMRDGYIIQSEDQLRKYLKKHPTTKAERRQLLKMFKNRPPGKIIYAPLTSTQEKEFSDSYPLSSLYSEEDQKLIREFLSLLEPGADQSSEWREILSKKLRETNIISSNDIRAFFRTIIDNAPQLFEDVRPRNRITVTLLLANTIKTYRETNPSLDLAAFIRYIANTKHQEVMNALRREGVQ